MYEIKFFDDTLGELFSYSEKVLFDDNKKDYEFLIADFVLINLFLSDFHLNI